MYKAVIFDLDGTLADTLESIAYATNKTLVSCGLKEQPIWKYKYFAGDGADVLIKRALAAAGDETGSYFDRAFAEYSAVFEQDCTYRVKPFEGIRKVLEAMKENNLKLAVVSNKPHARTLDVVEKLFGTDFFDFILGQREGLPKKPDPTGTLLAAKELGVNPKECMYVGDTNVDMETGTSAGMFTVGVLWGFRDKQELESHNANAIVSEPQKLMDLF